MRTVTAVDAHWLAELGPMFFSVKEMHNGRVEKRQKEKDATREMELEMQAVLDRKREQKQEELRKLAEARLRQVSEISVGGPSPAALAQKKRKMMGL
jgi:pre-mRNA-splicing factor ATP-dependent RNA helicase DHX38/PRP16